MIEFKQIIGRGTRLFEQKDYFIIYDFEDVYLKFFDEEWDGEPIDPDPPAEPKEPREPKEPKEKKEKEPKEKKVKEEKKNVGRTVGSLLAGIVLVDLLAVAHAPPAMAAAMSR